MEKTYLKIEGMTCGHCVKSVTKALTEMPGVGSASVELAEGTAVIEHDGTTDDDALIGAVREAGYSATSRP